MLNPVSLSSNAESTSAELWSGDGSTADIDVGPMLRQSSSSGQPSGRTIRILMLDTVSLNFFSQFSINEPATASSSSPLEAGGSVAWSVYGAGVRPGGGVGKRTIAFEAVVDVGDGVTSSEVSRSERLTAPTVTPKTPRVTLTSDIDPGHMVLDATD